MANLSPTIDICWTGGWDSTYRVLDLVINHKVDVQPHYIMPPDRKSLRHEIRAIRDIEAGLAQSFPEAYEHLRPTRFSLLERIASNQQVTQAYSEIRSRTSVPDQYEWINRYMAEHGISSMEIGTHSDDDTNHSRKLRKLSEEYLTDTGAPSRRLPASNTDPDLRLFRHLEIPLILMTKRQMEQQAVDGEFLDLLERSWFCHFPIGGQPCGCCHPCRDAMRSGMQHRIPRAGRIRFRIWPIIQAIRIYRQNPDRAKARLRERIRRRDIS